MKKILVTLVALGTFSLGVTGFAASSSGDLGVFCKDPALKGKNLDYTKLKAKLEEYIKSPAVKQGLSQKFEKVVKTMSARPEVRARLKKLNPDLNKKLKGLSVMKQTEVFNQAFTQQLAPAILGCLAKKDVLGTIVSYAKKHKCHIWKKPGELNDYLKAQVGPHYVACVGEHFGVHSNEIHALVGK